jgi:hypothetical protein
MKPLKERKTPLQSKRKVCAMMTLFERYVDETMAVINISANEITTYHNVYRVDIKNNKVEKVYPDPDFD